MILQGLKIDMTFVQDVFDSEFEGRQAVGHERLRKIKEHDIITTGNRHPNCKCESMGLMPGMTVDALLRLRGCAPHWVCPRLVSLRRSYGH